jgi:hypothetical protein
MMRARRMKEKVRIWKDEGRMNNDEHKEDER